MFSLQNILQEKLFNILNILEYYDLKYGFMSKIILEPPEFSPEAPEFLLEAT